MAAAATFQPTRVITPIIISHYSPGYPARLAFLNEHIKTLGLEYNRVKRDMEIMKNDLDPKSPGYVVVASFGRKLEGIKREISDAETEIAKYIPTA